MRIAIIGCGYTGSVIAQLLHQKGMRVTATTRNPDKLDNLSSFSSEALVFFASDIKTLRRLVQESDCLIITIAPDSSQEYEDVYLLLAKNIQIVAKECHTPKQLIYTSSTSVYEEHLGNPVSESSLLEKVRPSSLVLQKAENILSELKNLGWKVCILRLSEIYGPQRSLKEKLLKATRIPFAGKGERICNMVHVEDVARACSFCLEHSIEGTFNLTDDEHPTQKELFDKVCNKYHIEKMTWDPSKTLIHGGSKKVLNSAIKAKGFQFKFPRRDY